MARLIIKCIALQFFFFRVTLAANAVEPGQTTVTVKVHNNTGSSVSLYKVENGEANRIEFRWPKENDSCVFSFPLEKEAIFFFGKTSSKGSAHKYVIYLKPGENKLVHAYSSRIGLDFDSCKIVKPNAETLLLQKWTNLFNRYCKLGTNRNKREQYIEEYNDLVKQSQDLKTKSTGSNNYFRHLISSKIDAEIKYVKIAAFFNYGERMNSEYDTAAAHRAFYSSLTKENFCDPGLLHSEHGLQLLNYHLTFDLFHNSGNEATALAAPFVEKANLLCNDSLRRAYVLKRMKQVISYEQFQEEIEPFKRLFASAELALTYETKKNELTIYAKGTPAYNFSLTDTKEQPVSLADFKGKVVVLDIWAMWCAPCLKEKPFFQKIEEEFHDRDDIVFIGVSHDGLGQKEAWKKFVAKKGWNGIELIANYDESIGNYYKIEGIPRLMIFDRQGRIVTVNAPRPSDPEFKKLIERTIKNS